MPKAVNAKYDPLSDSIYVFDFDKTLVTLPVDIEHVRGQVLSLMLKHELPGPARPLLGVLEKMKRIGGDSLKAECENIIKKGELDAIGHATPMMGLKELDASLKGRDWAVHTNNNSNPVARCLEQWMAHGPALIVGRNDVGEPKPNPEGLVLSLIHI